MICVFIYCDSLSGLSALSGETVKKKKKKKKSIVYEFIVTATHSKYLFTQSFGMITITDSM